MHAFLPIVALWANIGLAVLDGPILQQNFLLSTEVGLKEGEYLGVEAFSAEENFTAIEGLADRGLGELFGRQSCYSGYHLCSSGRCCPDGSNCVTGGCCPGSSVLCTSTSCYYPSSQQCCSSGRVCSSTQVCVTGGCCSAGTQKCGTSGCYDPDTRVCCSSTSTSCPKGYDCVGNNFCCPSGTIRCGSTSKCYNPNTQICCSNGACTKGTTCCDNECCRNIAYCGSNGYCSRCPDATTTVTRTRKTTEFPVVTATKTTVTLITPSGFSCVPITAVNSVNASLVLGRNCGLTYYDPGEPAATSTNGLLRARQLSCTPYSTVTLTTTVWEYYTSTTTTTTTVTKSETELGFTCPTMAVTNTVGDVLSLNTKCALSLKLTNPSTTTSEGTTETGTGSSSSASSTAAGGSAASTTRSSGVLLWTLFGVWVASLIFVGVLL